MVAHQITDMPAVAFYEHNSSFYATATRLTSILINKHQLIEISPLNINRRLSAVKPQANISHTDLHRYFYIIRSTDSEQ